MTGSLSASGKKGMGDVAEGEKERTVSSFNVRARVLALSAQYNALSVSARRSNTLRPLSGPRARRPRTLCLSREGWGWRGGAAWRRGGSLAHPFLSLLARVTVALKYM